MGSFLYTAIMNLTPTAPRPSSDAFTFEDVSVTWANDIYVLEEVAVSSAADYTIPIASPKFLCLLNVGSNNVRYGPKSGGVRIDWGLLIPGLPTPIFIDTVGTFTLRWEAVTGTQNVLVLNVST